MRYAKYLPMLLAALSHEALAVPAGSPTAAPAQLAVRNIGSTTDSVHLRRSVDEDDLPALYARDALEARGKVEKEKEKKNRPAPYTRTKPKKDNTNPDDNEQKFTIPEGQGQLILADKGNPANPANRGAGSPTGGGRHENSPKGGVPPVGGDGLDGLSDALGKVDVHALSANRKFIVSQTGQIEVDEGAEGDEDVKMTG